MFWTRRPNWPGTQAVFQPGGLEGPGVATNEADLAQLLEATYTGIYGGGQLVIDGQFSAGLVELTALLDLRSTFDVRLVNVETLNLAFPGSGDGLFQNPRSVVESDLQCTVTRSTDTTNHFVRTLDGNTNNGFKLKNIIWDPVDFAATNIGAMVRSDNGATRWWFEDCALQPDLAAVTRAADRWFQVAGTAPSALELAWYGPNAGQLTATGVTLMQTALTGWDTAVRYGAFTGPAMSLVGISWAANAPTVVNRQP